jgi:alpha-D-ribose 1-methylphosphonate 5-triphosphate synthase subunit PhnH
MAAIACALVDYETPVWLDAPLAASADVVAWLRFETGAPIITEPARAAFALVADPLALPPLSVFALGSDDYPDRATTLMIQVTQFGGGEPMTEPMTLSGPGLERPRDFSAAPLPVDFAERQIANRELFPRGVDVVLIGDGAIAALPRSVRVVRRRN